MEYEETTKTIMTKFPQFKIDNLNYDLPYCVAGDFAHYLLELYIDGDMRTLVDGLEFIESLYHSNSLKVKALATVGYLEGIQNVWGNNNVDPELVFNYLGTESQKWWVELNKFWNGEIKYLGYSFENK